MYITILFDLQDYSHGALLSCFDIRRARLDASSEQHAQHVQHGIHEVGNGNLRTAQLAFQVYMYCVN